MGCVQPLTQFGHMHAQRALKFILLLTSPAKRGEILALQGPFPIPGGEQFLSNGLRDHRSELPCKSNYMICVPLESDFLTYVSTYWIHDFFV